MEWFFSNRSQSTAAAAISRWGETGYFSLAYRKMYIFESTRPPPPQTTTTVRATFGLNAGRFTRDFGRRRRRWRDRCINIKYIYVQTQNNGNNKRVFCRERASPSTTTEDFHPWRASAGRRAQNSFNGARARRVARRDVTRLRRRCVKTHARHTD